jgi:ribosomal protein S27AE
MVQKRRKRCPECGFLDTVKRGKRGGATRWYCKNCGSYFTDRRPHITSKNKEVWFREWIVGRQTIEQLAARSGKSVRSLKRYFYDRLPNCPTWHIQRRERVNLLIDGTYFPNKVCLVLYRDAAIKMTIFYRLTKGEHLHDLKEDLLNICRTGIEIESVTCDGAPNILRAVREVCPNAILQRCTVHIAREIRTWLTRRPKSPAARQLLNLVVSLGRVKTPEQAGLWMRAFIDWHNEHKEFINQKSFDETTGRWWYTHRMLHRSDSHIRRALPEMLNYTRHERVPKSSNSIEGFFSHLKNNMTIHRGLSHDHFRDFVKWYLFFHSNLHKIPKN